MPSPAITDDGTAGGAACCVQQQPATTSAGRAREKDAVFKSSDDIITPSTASGKPDPIPIQNVEMPESESKDKKTNAGGKRNNNSGNNWRKRNRGKRGKVFNRNHHRSRPYPSREWDGERVVVNQSLNLDQEQEKRANFVKMSMQKYGKPYAPYNTTQFLMEDHNVREPEFEEISRLLRMHQDQEDSNVVVGKDGAENDSFSTRDGSDSEEFYSSPDDEQDFQQRQFSEVYEHVHAERLSSMSKNQLVQEYMLLEEKAEDLEKKLKVAQSMMTETRSRTMSNATPSAETAEADTIAHLKAEIKRLTEENDRLRYTSQPQSSSLSPTRRSSSDIADSCTHPEAIPTSTSSAS